MPKKLNTNPKAEAARERKEGVKKEKLATLEKEVEDSKWSDAGTTRTEKRKAEAEAKRREEAAKKAEKKALEAKDKAELEKTIGPKAPKKVTAYEMQQQQQKSAVELKKLADQQEAEKKRILQQPEPEVNVNQQMRQLRLEEEEKYGRDNVLDATGVDQALTALSKQFGDANAGEKHPEKRMKAAHKAYEDREFPRLKAENLSLKYSQLKQLLWDEWLKSPENPINQAKLAAAAESDV